MTFFGQPSVQNGKADGEIGGEEDPCQIGEEEKGRKPVVAGEGENGPRDRNIEDDDLDGSERRVLQAEEEDAPGRFSESWAPKIASGEPERSKLPVVRQTSQAEIAIRK